MSGSLSLRERAGVRGEGSYECRIANYEREFSEQVIPACKRSDAGGDPGIDRIRQIQESRPPLNPLPSREGRRSPESTSPVVDLSLYIFLTSFYVFPATFLYLIR
jgi:hypothetical protein